MSAVISPDNDPLGRAVHDYHFNGARGRDITVYSSVSGPDVIPVQYLFRDFGSFPDLEKQAVLSCEGSILDVGAGTGCHSLELKNRGKHVTALEKSSLCCEVIKDKGIEPVFNNDFFTFSEKKFDTLLFLMNGIGITGYLENLHLFFRQCHILLNDGGKILLDSSDLIYLYTDENDQLENYFEHDNGYYGEVEYIMQYGKIRSEPFNWLFVDFNTLQKIASENGFSAKLRFTDGHHGYLAEFYAESQLLY